MSSIDEQLEKVISRDRIYTSKLMAHLAWDSVYKHLLVITSFLEKRYILLKEYDEIDFKWMNRNLYIYEVVKDFETYEHHERIANCIYESDWLGEYSFILKTNRFNSEDARRLLEKNYSRFIYLQNQSIETIASIPIDFCIGVNKEISKAGFCWIKQDSPFYLEEGILCPRKNCATDGFGVIWCAKEEAEFIMEQITLITQKFNRNGSHFNLYQTTEDFLDDVLSVLTMIGNKTIKPAAMKDWSIKVLSGYSVS
ncbi:hypothetical protein [Bacillus benzoevorans]|uniref:Uncharacterized protein n=1 Tax=Bacillus benzoevorans TaxID=1456 RepID=A0A7X0HT41_9BACI|nr:hypothetical protein [Bacillus benzoevorans]MBB6446313.1 hypothetical protein [Bacillus benzoevorans]